MNRKHATLLGAPMPERSCLFIVFDGTGGSDNARIHVGTSGAGCISLTRPALRVKDLGITALAALKREAPA